MDTFYFYFYWVGCAITLVFGILGTCKLNLEKHPTWVWLMSGIICVPIWTLIVLCSWVTLVVTLLLSKKND